LSISTDREIVMRTKSTKATKDLSCVSPEPVNPIKPITPIKMEPDGDKPNHFHIPLPEGGDDSLKFSSGCQSVDAAEQLIIAAMTASSKLGKGVRQRVSPRISVA
jgi:hypothetical protein